MRTGINCPSRVLLLFILFLLPIASLSQEAADAEMYQEKEDQALVVLATDDEDILWQVIERVERWGADIPHVFPPSAMVVVLNKDAERFLRRKAALVTRDSVANPAQLRLLGGSAEHAALIWNRSLAIEHAPPPAPHGPLDQTPGGDVNEGHHSPPRDVSLRDATGGTSTGRSSDQTD